MINNVVITGIGYVLPIGAGNGEQLQACLMQRQNSEMSINEDAIRHLIPERLWDKIDAFCRYSLAAATLAVEHAGIVPDNEDMTRFGCFVGNTFGGWRFTERELQKLYAEGARAVSPYQATSWFPAAIQGQLSLAFGIKGFSKTYMLDRASSLLSLISAAQKIADGTLDIALAGGAESTNTIFLREVLSGTEVPCAHSNDASGTKIPQSEGSIFLILENEDHARKHQRRIYGRFSGYGMANFPSPPDTYCDDPQTMIKVMEKAAQSYIPGSIYPDLSDQRSANNAELAAMEFLWPEANISYHKTITGHTFGAEGALEVAVACTANAPSPVLINSRAPGGMCVSLLVHQELS